MPVRIGGLVSDKLYTVACHVGRLVELRTGIFTSPAHFAKAQVDVANVLGKVKEPILCIDARSGRLLPEPLAEAGLEAMRSDNPLIFRCATLVASPMFAMQLARLSREANNVRRKIFDNAGHLFLWLRPHLNDQEFERLLVFLGEDPSVPDLPAGSGQNSPAVP